MNAENEPQSGIQIEQQSDLPDPSARSQAAKAWFPLLYVTQEQFDNAFAWFFYWLPIGMVVFIIAPQILKRLVR